MKIIIKNRWTRKIILEGEYDSLKEALKKNSSSDLRGSDLRGSGVVQT